MKALGPSSSPCMVGLPQPPVSTAGTKYMGTACSLPWDVPPKSIHSQTEVQDPGPLRSAPATLVPGLLCISVPCPRPLHSSSGAARATAGPPSQGPPARFSAPPRRSCALPRQGDPATCPWSPLLDPWNAPVRTLSAERRPRARRLTWSWRRPRRVLLRGEETEAQGRASGADRALRVWQRQHVGAVTSRRPGLTVPSAAMGQGAGGAGWHTPGTCAQNLNLDPWRIRHLKGLKGRMGSYARWSPYALAQALVHAGAQLMHADLNQLTGPRLPGVGGPRRFLRRAGRV